MSKAMEYLVYVSEDWKDLQDSMLLKFPTKQLNITAIPKPAGGLERVTLRLPPTPFTQFIGLVSVDANKNRGCLSNIVQVILEVDITDTKNITENTTDPEILTITTDDPINLYILYGGISGGILIFILIINIIICALFCKRCKKNHSEQNNNLKLSVVETSERDSRGDIIDYKPDQNPLFQNAQSEDYSSREEINHEFPREHSAPVSYARVHKKEMRNSEQNSNKINQKSNQTYAKNSHIEKDLGCV